MLVAKGWFGIVMAILWIVGGFYIQWSIGNTEKNAWHYSGEVFLTIFQYNQLLKESEIEATDFTVIKNTDDMIDIKYDVLTGRNTKLEYVYGFKGEHRKITTPAWGMASIFPIVFWIIGFLQAYIAIDSLKRKKQPTQEKVKS